MIGFFNINKAAGMTSHDVVARMRRVVGRGVKVGHAGTLDPAATGVLPVAVGQATRLIEYLTDAQKGYRALVALGTTTTTDDAEGEVLEQRAVPPLDHATLEAVLQQFRGPIMQVPPMYSALHHQGQRLYDLARQGQHIELEPRPVTISRLDLLAWSPDTAHLALLVECSKGTYIRALARDIGAALGCGAHLAVLERTFVGSFTVDAAAPLETLQQAADLSPYLLPPDVVVSDWFPVTLSEGQARRVGNGNTVHLPNVAEARVRAYTADGRLLALLECPDPAALAAQWQPLKVLQ
ncbi:MAG: tRNA pseudouridine(55) synthase TruB [Chloroflexaceae bacterium]|nr:tRNA pseudouridine(55) synthase TruB [Chloroflexaceae bacterium]